MDSISIKYDGYLYLDVNVEDKINGNFIFDTGWSGVCLDSMFSKKNKLVENISNTNILINGIGYETRTAQFITDTINYKFKDISYRCHSINTLMFNLKKMAGREIDGIFGIETFAQRPYMIDYASQKIIFTDSVKGFEEIKAKFEDNKIFLSLNIKLKNNNTIQGKFLLDTGSDQTIINNYLFKTDGIYNAISKKRFFAKGGIGGDSNGYFLPVQEINIGKYNIKNIIATVSSDTLGMLSNTDFMGIIGNDILDDFHIIFDHQKEKIWVKRNKNFNKNKKKLFRGISFLDNGEKWVVSGIVEDTEAYKIGVRMNDQILKINNISVEQIDLDKFVDTLKANDVLNLKIKRDDEERDIKFKLNVFLKA